jgi:hypothetical protein
MPGCASQIQPQPIAPLILGGTLLLSSRQRSEPLCRVTALDDRPYLDTSKRARIHTPPRTAVVPVMRRHDREPRSKLALLAARYQRSTICAELCETPLLQRVPNHALKSRASTYCCADWRQAPLKEAGCACWLRPACASAARIGRTPRLQMLRCGRWEVPDAREPPFDLGAASACLVRSSPKRVVSATGSSCSTWGNATPRRAKVACSAAPSTFPARAKRLASIQRS